MACNESFDVFFLFDRLETGIQNKISKSLIAHYCSYLESCRDKQGVLRAFHLLYVLSRKEVNLARRIA